MTRPAITSLSLLATRCLAGTPVTPAKPEKHPRDHEANARWACELENAPEDSVLIELFALRQGLCQMVDARSLSVDKPTAIFERARGRATIERRKEERERLRDRGLRL